MRDILKGHVTWLKGNSHVRVEIEGHCDERGTNEYNLALGAKRAESVKRYLIDLGIAQDRCRRSATAKSFIYARSKTNLAGQRTGARTLSSRLVQPNSPWEDEAMAGGITGI